MAGGPCIALAQLDLLVGDVQGNLARVREAALAARQRGADLVVFPELTLSGYPPEDLLFHRGLRIQLEEALAQLAREVRRSRFAAARACSWAIPNTKARAAPRASTTLRACWCRAASR